MIIATIVILRNYELFKVIVIVVVAALSAVVVVLIIITIN